MTRTLRALAAPCRAFSSTVRILNERVGPRITQYDPSASSSSSSGSSAQTPGSGPRVHRPYARLGRADPATRQRASEIMSMLITPGAGAASSAASGAAVAPLPTEEFTQQELLSSQQRFVAGDVYAPNDLTMEELNARRGNRKPVRDAFDLVGINPITQYKNYNLLSEYVTSMGRIMHSKETGLRPVNQRRMAKAIRRAVGIGFLPSVHRHPEVLKNQENMMTGRMGRMGGMGGMGGAMGGQGRR